MPSEHELFVTHSDHDGELEAARARYEREDAMVVNMGDYRFELIGEVGDDLFSVALVHLACFDNGRPNSQAVVHYLQDGDVMHTVLTEINAHEKSFHRAPVSALEQAITPIPTEEPK